MITNSTLEITTTLGCRVNCRYCPQEQLARSGLSKGVHFLSLCDFRSVCLKLPRPFSLHFTGFAEPFLNPECGCMIRHAAMHGFRLTLSTTLEGVRPADLEIFTSQLFQRVVLHLPSNETLMNLKVSEHYVCILEVVLQTLRSTDLIVTFGNGYHERLAPLVASVSGFVETRVVTPTSTGWYTRAGNNLLFKKPPDLTNHSHIKCSKNRLYQNVMLPDGTVILCCMDWSGEHVLGSLLTQTYDDVVNGLEFHRVLNGMRDNKSNTLCWRCEYAVPR